MDDNHRKENLYNVKDSLSNVIFEHTHNHFDHPTQFELSDDGDHLKAIIVFPDFKSILNHGPLGMENKTMWKRMAWTIEIIITIDELVERCRVSLLLLGRIALAHSYFVEYGLTGLVQEGIDQWRKKVSALGEYTPLFEQWIQEYVTPSFSKPLDDLITEILNNR